MLLAITLTALFVLLLIGAWVYFTQPVFLGSSPSPAQLDPEHLRRHVVALSQEFHPRNHTMTTNLELSAKYILSHFALAGARTNVQEFTVASGKIYKNISGTFGPATGHRIVVGAHYDSCAITPGANDNASGVAGLIELAYLLGRETNLPGNVELVAYSLEEPPYFGTPDMGSARHAKALREQGVKVRVMISLEMIGYFSDETNSQKRPDLFFQ